MKEKKSQHHHINMYNFNNKSILILKLSPLSVLIQLDTASSITRALLILIFSALFLKYTKILLTSHESLLITPPSYRIQNPCTSPLTISWTPLLTETHSDNVSRTPGDTWWHHSAEWHARWPPLPTYTHHSPLALYLPRSDL